MYVKTTRGIKIIATPAYLDQQSAPADNHYVWSYTIQLENIGGSTVQLLTRHWKITDGLGRLQEVRGEGVIGEQPVLEPSGKYHYTSGAALTTPSGIMVGSYQMVNVEDGTKFDVEIPAFSLDCPYQVARLN